MGLGAELNFQPLQSFFNSKGLKWPQLMGQLEDKQLPATNSAKNASDSALLGAGASEDNLESVTYSSKMQQLSLFMELQSIREHISEVRDGEGSLTEASAEQMQFSFVGEMEMEEIQIFNQRVGKVAEGMEGQQKETFTMTAQRVSIKFSMSMTMSSQALRGYADGAEALQDNEEGMGQFIDIVNQAMDKMDELANQLLTFVNDLMSGEGELQQQIEAFLSELGATGFLDGVEAQNPDALPAAEGAQQGQVTTQAFSMQMEFEFEYISISVEQTVQESDPIVLDLDGDGIELSSYRQGARFDITGEGRQVTTAFVTGGDAFLAIDSNGNGEIDSGKELFGDQNGAANGFEELRKYDSNEDGRINAHDRHFNALKLFRDNGNGKTEKGELMGLADAGVREILLGYQNVSQMASGGNRIEQLASFIREDGSQGTAADAILNYTI